MRRNNGRSGGAGILTFALCVSAVVGAVSGCVATSSQGANLSARAYGGSQSVTLVNDLGQRVCYVNMVPSGLESWGDDWLGASEVFEPGASRAFAIAPLPT